jgi:glycosyltransferase involved in cell wall biosynthesis
MGASNIVGMRNDAIPAATTKGRPNILYLTFEGILEPLGRSQVLRYVRDLHERDFRYTILSLEHHPVIESGDEVNQLEAELAASSIGWKHLVYQTGSSRAVIGNVIRAFRSARSLIRERQIQLIHARSYVAAGVAFGLRVLTGVPYIFDMRGYWIDERAAEGRLFNNRIVYSTGKWVERLLLRHAAGVVTLTSLMANDLRETVLRNSSISTAVIPTCTDYEEFALAKDRAPDSVLPADVLARLHSKLVVGMVGSVNASYCLDESLTLFKKLLLLRPDAHLLCISQQTEVISQRVKDQGIPEESFTIVKAQHRDMPRWLRHMDWAFLMLHERFAKRGSMPTKLGELLASGVRPIQYGCNQEVREIVEQSGSGIVLDGITQEDLDLAARKIAANPLANAEVVTAREISRRWFDINSGVVEYQRLLSEVFQIIELNGTGNKSKENEVRGY